MTTTKERAAHDTPAAPAATGIGRPTMVGFAWLLGQTIATKVVNLASQILLANLLLPADYDLVALAYTVTTFSGLLQQSGLREVLVQKGREARNLTSAAVWLSLATGLGAGLLNCALAPLAAWFYGRPELARLLYVFALANPVAALIMVPLALLQVELRFRFIATVEWSAFAAGAALTVLLAWVGLGALSFVVPVPLVALVRLVAYWSAARPSVRVAPEVARWRALLGSNLGVLGGNLAATVTYQGDYIALGRFQPPSVVGTYYLAFNFSTQTIRVFTSNLSTVLLPALTKFENGTRRQIDAFLSATRLLTTLAVPLLLLQALLAEPLVHLLLPARWYTAIPILQILSIGMVGRLVAGPSQSLLLAQGRFRAYFWISVLYAFLFLPVVIFLGKIGAVETAIGVTACMCVHGPAQIYVAIRKSGCGTLEILRLFRGSLLAALPAAGFALAIGTLAAPGRAHTFARAAIFCAATLIAYVPIVRLTDPQATKELIRRVRALRPATRQA